MGTFKEPVMNYSQYLFGQLMQAHLGGCGNVPYDILFPKTMCLYDGYEGSEYDVEDKSEYDCMVNYIRNNEMLLIETLGQWE